MNCASAGAMFFRQQKKFDASEEGIILRDLRLIESQNISAIIELHFNGIEPFSFNMPGLFVDQYVWQGVAFSVGNFETKNILSVVFNCVPTRRPGRQR